MQIEGVISLCGGLLNLNFIPVHAESPRRRKAMWSAGLRIDVGLARYLYRQNVSPAIGSEQADQLGT